MLRNRVKKQVTCKNLKSLSIVVLKIKFLAMRYENVKPFFLFLDSTTVQI